MNTNISCSPSSICTPKPKLHRQSHVDAKAPLHISMEPGWVHDCPDPVMCTDGCLTQLDISCPGTAHPAGTEAAISAPAGGFLIIKPTFILPKPNAN